MSPRDSILGYVGLWFNVVCMDFVLADVMTGFDPETFKWICYFNNEFVLVLSLILNLMVDSMVMVQ